MQALPTGGKAIYVLINEKASHLIQAATILTFIVSSYLVVFKYPTPMAISEKMRRD